MKSERLKKLSPYLFAELDKLKHEARSKGIDIIDLSVGDPDLPPPRELNEMLKDGIDQPKMHNYPEYAGSIEFRKAISKWMSMRHGIELDPDGEILSLIGSKEAIVHLMLGVIDPMDHVILMSPYFPPYLDAITIAGGIPHVIKANAGNNYQISFDNIPNEVREKAKLILINYPNNPTGAVATLETFKSAVEFAKKNNIVLCNDAAYIEIHHGEKPHSIFDVDGAKDVAIELHSFSKTFNIPGWRAGFAAGNSQVISALARVKQIVDSGQFKPIQKAIAYAMENLKDHPASMNAVYKKRGEILADALNNAGIETMKLQATFYLWARIPKGFTSAKFCSELLSRAQIVATPGSGFGVSGEGYVRFSLTESDDRIVEAAKRISHSNFS